jgi:hypothetical protein
MTYVFGKRIAVALGGNEPEQLPTSGKPRIAAICSKTVFKGPLMSIPSPAIKLDQLYSREATDLNGCALSRLHSLRSWTHIAFTQERLNGFRNLRSATSNSLLSTTDIKTNHIYNLTTAAGTPPDLPVEC